MDLNIPQGRVLRTRTIFPESLASTALSRHEIMYEGVLCTKTCIICETHSVAVEHHGIQRSEYSEYVVSGAHPSRVNHPELSSANAPGPGANQFSL